MAETGSRHNLREPQVPEAIHKSELGNTVAISEREVLMSVFVMLLGLAVLILEFLLLRTSQPPPSEVLRVFAVTLIIISALFTIPEHSMSPRLRRL
jgi:hypothetical protein